MERQDIIKRHSVVLNKVQEYRSLDIERLLGFLHEVPKLEMFKKFNLYVHGGLLDHPEDTEDIDLKITRRQKPLCLLEIENFMIDLELLARRSFQVYVDFIFLTKIAQYINPWKPTHEIIDDYDPPVFQALFNPDKRGLLWGPKNLAVKYLYHRKPRIYRKIGSLQVYYSGEWAAKGHKFNPGFQNLSKRLKKDIGQSATSQAAVVFDHIQNLKFHQPYKIPYLKNIEIRDILKSIEDKPITTMKEFGERFLHQYTEKESAPCEKLQ